jgi:hypothetical protein
MKNIQNGDKKERGFYLASEDNSGEAKC